MTGSGVNRYVLSELLAGISWEVVDGKGSRLEELSRHIAVSASKAVDGRGKGDVFWMSD
jgi:hypothetical protein